MAGPVDVEEQDILNGILQDPAYAGYATLHIGLSSTTPTEAGANFTEPATGAYARVSTVAADWGAASGSAPAVKSNTAVKTFPQATADWLAGGEPDPLRAVHRRLGWDAEVVGCAGDGEAGSQR